MLARHPDELKIGRLEIGRLEIGPTGRAQRTHSVKIAIGVPPI